MCDTHTHKEYTVSFARPLWPHQTRGVNGVFAAEKAGHRRILVASPTGMGKSAIAAYLVRDFLEVGQKVALYCHRKMLTEQLSSVMKGFGLDHGILAAGYKDEREKPFQIVSTQTADARTNRREEHNAEQLFDADLVLIEEAHLQGGESMQRIVKKHLEKPKCTVVGITATPIDLSHAYDILVQAGVNSEGRTAGALVAAHHFGPDEPDLKGIKQELGQDLTENENKKAIMRKGIFGRVLDNYRTLNPEQRPTILFAPGVAESIWFAEEFEKAGIPAAHIDGDNVWIRGEMHASSRALRQEVLDGSRSGDIRVVCNRFVLREGIDAPWLSHGIFATVFGSLQSYLQSGGRLLRASGGTGKLSATIQDHGGCLDTLTEVLTMRGWVGCDGIQDSDIVAAYHRGTGKIEWKPILHRHDRIIESGEKMFEVQSRCVNMRVTGNHRILTKKRVNVGTGKSWPKGYEFTRADALSASSVRCQIPVSGFQDAPGLPLTDDELRFLGWWLTDGTMAGKRRAVSISQADHQPQIEDLRACLKGCGFDFTETKQQPTAFSSKPQTKFHIPKGTCKSRPRNGWIRLERWMDKNLNDAYENISAAQFDILLHAIHLGDGSKSKGEGAYSISTGNKTFADRLQSLSVRRGWKCNVRTGEGHTRVNPIYILNMVDTDSTTIHGAEAKTADDQAKMVESTSLPGVTRVWCIANELETLVTRRNGMVAIIGNSWWRHGSLNEDRHWSLDDTAARLAGTREELMRSKKVSEPVRCRVCSKIGPPGKWCSHCGADMRGQPKTRMVVQSDGTLRPMEGDVFKERKIDDRPEAERIWEKVFYRARNAGFTFNQARGLYQHENWGMVPPPGSKLTPKVESYWYLKVSDVPRSDLN